MWSLLGSVANWNAQQVLAITPIIKAKFSTDLDITFDKEYVPDKEHDDDMTH